MINFKAELYPVGYESYNHYNHKTVVTAENRQKAMDKIIKVLMKYRLPYDMRTVDGFTLIEVTGEAYKRNVNRKPKAKPQPVEPPQPEIICTQHESGRYEWHYTKTGRRVMGSFPYDAERETQMRKEIARGIERNMKADSSFIAYRGQA